MIRRVFLKSLLTATSAAALGFSFAATGAARAQDRVALQAAFEALPASARSMVQSELQIAGLYQGALDGQYGRQTEAALIAGAEFLAYNSRGQVNVDLSSAAGASAYLRGLAGGEFAAWLYGEGGECDDC
jgi:peptidoglycan hydrolase-like protein with peptidoglycan-binding domain